MATVDVLSEVSSGSPAERALSHVAVHLRAAVDLEVEVKKRRSRAWFPIFDLLARIREHNNEMGVTVQDAFYVFMTDEISRRGLDEDDRLELVESVRNKLERGVREAVAKRRKALG